MPELSPVDIVNSALDKINETEIQSLDQGSKAARVARRQFPIQLGVLLRAYRWNFSIARVVLAPYGEAPTFGFTNRFRVPDDYSRLIGIADARQYQTSRFESNRNYSAQYIVHKVEGRYILADVDALYLIYNRNVPDSGDFDDLFDEALAWKLAMEFSLSIAESNTKHRIAKEGFKEHMRMARIANAFETTAEHVEASEWLDARYMDNAYGPREGPVV